ncbi:MAG TPA: helix-hairpin-helix domain-containing protein [Methylibium sp.]|uniref:helix-hairpin-helix domain-containing protein n=1 Tax=Methylibium sp. TaxID=2067992 RepID=UPI002DB98C7A|nr:helix-hairpin-helix domain-containing protein [Methylibium sp.]HEU4460609.1 helix-hairpin-helix domain-containing protein [Methylibium sp.]
MNPKIRSPRKHGLAKAGQAADCEVLEQIPNIGSAMADDLRRIGIERPQQLLGRDALDLYRRVCEHRGARQDPCVLDTLMAATDFMRGAAPAPWWQYTVARKARYGQVLDAGGAGLGPRRAQSVQSGHSGASSAS